MDDFDFFGIPLSGKFITFCTRLDRAGWLVPDIPPTNEDFTLIIGLQNYEWTDENFPCGVDIDFTTRMVYQIMTYFTDDYGLQTYSTLFNYVTERYGEFTIKLPTNNNCTWEFDNGRIMLFHNQDSTTVLAFTNYLTQPED